MTERNVVDTKQAHVVFAITFSFLTSIRIEMCVLCLEM